MSETKRQDFGRRVRACVAPALLVAVVAALAAAAFVPAKPAAPSKAGGDIYRDIDRFVGVLQHIRHYYVDDTDDEKLVRAALKRMLGDLDPHTQFLESDELGELKVGTSGKYSGVGMEISTRRGYPVVISPMEGTPAQRAGLQTGDLIIKVDGEDTFGMLLQDVSAALKGPAGTSVSLTVVRTGEPDPLSFAVVRDIIHIPSIAMSAVIDSGIGYVRLARSAAGSAAELDACLDGLESKGIGGLIVDLRGNPGGLLLEAVKVCDQFLPEGKLVVFTRGRNAGENFEYLSRSGRTRKEIPLVLLVDGGTASAAEIIAGAVQDWDLGLIAGQETFGKGSVQRVMELGGDQALKLTTSYYYTPSGRCIHRNATEEDLGKDQTSGAAEEFVTAGGRRVLGGGGIAPDVFVAAEALPKLVRDLERRGVFFNFAVDYAGKNPNLNVPEIDDGTMESFREFVMDEGISLEESEFESARGLLALGVRRELTRRLRGDQEAGIVAMEGDAQVRAALEFLRKARTAQDLFDLAIEYNNGQKR